MRIFITQNDMIPMKNQTLAYYVHFVCPDVIFAQFNYPNANHVWFLCFFSALPDSGTQIGFHFGSRLKK